MIELEEKITNILESSSLPVNALIDQNNNSGKTSLIKDNTRTNGSIFPPPLPVATKKRNRSQTNPSNANKKARSSMITSNQEHRPSIPPCLLPLVNNPDEHIFRRPTITKPNLPPITIEQLLGLRGDIPDVHNWTTHDLNEFFHQQGYDYASILLNQYQINGNRLYELKREQVFRMSTLKIGKTLKLWNVMEQIQRKFFS